MMMIVLIYAFLSRRKVVTLEAVRIKPKGLPVFEVHLR